MSAMGRRRLRSVELLKELPNSRERSCAARVIPGGFFIGKSKPRPKVKAGVAPQSCVLASPKTSRHDHLNAGRAAA